MCSCIIHSILVRSIGSLVNLVLEYTYFAICSILVLTCSLFWLTKSSIWPPENVSRMNIFKYPFLLILTIPR